MGILIEVTLGKKQRKKEGADLAARLDARAVMIKNVPEGPVQGQLVPHEDAVGSTAVTGKRHKKRKLPDV